MPPKKQMVPKKVKVNVLNLSGQMKILDLLKGGTSLVEVGRHYSICSTVLNSMHPEHPMCDSSCSHDEQEERSAGRKRVHRETARHLD
jgi:hypothetical protein